MTRPVPPLRFLVVEDELLIAMDIASLVEDAGHIVVAEAASLREVSALTDDVKPDVAFVDLHLAEGSNGFDATGVILKRWPQVVVVFVTANPRKLAEGHAHAHAAVAKPFSRNGLLSAVHYLAEGVCDPPPSGPRPPNFIEFPEFAATWTS